TCALPISRKTQSRGFDLAAALLLEPVEPVEFDQFTCEDVAQLRQVPDVERGVVEQLLGQGALGPVGLLRLLGQFDVEVVLQKRGEAHPLSVKQLRGEHGVEDALCLKAAQVVQEAQVVVAAVHDQMLLRQPLPQGRELHRREGVDHEHPVFHEELQQADSRAVPVHVVRLGVEAHLVDVVQRVQQWGELPRLIEQFVTFRSGWFHLRTEQTAHSGGEEARNHYAAPSRTEPVRAASIRCGSSAWQPRSRPAVAGRCDARSQAPGVEESSVSKDITVMRWRTKAPKPAETSTRSGSKAITVSNRCAKPWGATLVRLLKIPRPLRNF